MLPSSASQIQEEQKDAEERLNYVSFLPSCLDTSHSNDLQRQHGDLPDRYYSILSVAAILDIRASLPHHAS